MTTGGPLQTTRRWLLWAAAAACAAILVARATVAPAAPVHGSADPLRTGWYPDQTLLTPELVSGGTFGKVWTTQVLGQVLAQPLVWNGVVLVVTARNQVYGLDPATGAIKWSRSVGAAFKSSDVYPDGGDSNWVCPDLAPWIGITGTPVIDDATGVAYFVSKTYADGVGLPGATFLHGVDMGTGNEAAGFPVEIKGTAQNQPGQRFVTQHQLQRPGLLLMGGVVYAAFGGHCDFRPYQGWIAGVSTAGALTTLWTDRSGSPTGCNGDPLCPNGSGNGIWMAGGGLMSDKPGSFLFSVGNGFAGASPTGSIPGNLPPADLGESVVRVSVQADGTLKATDFFTPTNAAALDNADSDYGSGGVVGLPSQYFGTTSHPNLAVHASKEGYLVLYDRDSLGGCAQGPAGTDGVLAKLGPQGAGVFGRAGVWPGDGGFIYLPVSGHFSGFQYGVTAGGAPTFTLAGTSADYEGYTSGSPVVTSAGTTTGSALVWQIWMADASGNGGQLRAYDPVPVAGVLQQRLALPIGTAAKFSVPGVGGGRLFVGTREGTVVGVGSPISTKLSGGPLSFEPTVLGQKRTLTETLTAGGPTTVTALKSSTADFTLGAPSPALPATLATGQTLTVQVTFSPAAAGLKAATLDITSSDGVLQEGLSGSGLVAGPKLTATPRGLDFGTVAIGAQVSTNITLRNAGGTSLTISAATGASAPFTTIGLPAAGAVIPSAGARTVTINFAPTAAGGFDDALHFSSDGGDLDVPISAVAAPPGLLVVSPLTLDFGTVAIGDSKTFSFSVANAGGTDLSVLRSKPGTGGSFLRGADLFEGSLLPAGTSLAIPIEFAPVSVGPQTAFWSFNSNGLGGLQTVTFTGTGRAAGLSTIPDPAAGGWQLNGGAVVLGGLRGSLLQLTAAQPALAGSAFWPTAIGSANLDVTFLATLGSGTGGDGLALVLADPARAQATAVGASGPGLGFAGIGGLAVALGTVQGGTNPSANFVGLSDGPVAAGTNLHWLATSTAVPPLRAAPRLVRVQALAGTLLVFIDGVLALSQQVALPASVLVGFSGGTGTLTDRHAVSDVHITSGTREASPTVSLSPSSGAALGGTVALHASAAAAPGGAITEVALRLDGTVLLRAATSTADASWDTTLAANGAHTLDATATGADGAVGSASAEVLVVNAPHVAVASPADGAKVAGVVQVIARASPPVGTALSSVALLLDDVKVASGSAATLSYAWDTRALPNGSAHTLRALAVDADGTSASAYPSMVAVSNPPLVALTRPAPGARVSGEVLVAATASAPSGTTVSSTTLTLDGAALVSQAGAGASATWQTALFPNGPHTLGASAVDADESAGSAVPVLLTVANPPAVALSVKDGDTVAGAVQLQASATAPQGTSVSSTTLTVGRGVLVASVLPRVTFALDTTGLPNGAALAVTGTALDADGVSATSKATVTVRNPPQAQLASPRNGDVVSGAVTISAAGTPALGATLASLALFIDGAQVASGPAPLAFRWDTSALAPGSTHTLLASATSGDGLSASSAPVGVVVADPQAGHPPVVAVQAPADGAQVSGTTRVTVLAAAPAASSLRAVTLRLDGVQVATGAFSPLVWSWDTSTAASGAHLLAASAADADGATADSAPVQVTVSNDFLLVASPGARVLTAGGAVQTVAVFASAHGATQPITLGLTGAPPGVRFSFAPTSITGEGVSTLTLTAPPSTAPTPEATALVTGASVGVPGGRTTPLALSVAVPPRVAITPLLSSTVSGPVNLQVSAINDAKAPLVSLDLYDGATHVAGAATSPLAALWDTRGVPNGVHTLTALALDTLGNTASASLVMTVLNDFTLTLAPASATLVPGGGAVTLALASTVTGGAEPLTLSAAGLPDGVTATFTPNPLIAGKSGALSLQAGPAAALTTGAGFTVVATSASVPSPGHAVSARVEVTARSSGSGGCGSGAALWPALLGLFALRRRRTVEPG